MKEIAVSIKIPEDLHIKAKRLKSKRIVSSMNQIIRDGMRNEIARLEDQVCEAECANNGASQ